MFFFRLNNSHILSSATMECDLTIEIHGDSNDIEIMANRLKIYLGRSPSNIRIHECYKGRPEANEDDIVRVPIYIVNDKIDIQGKDRLLGMHQYAINVLADLAAKDVIDMCKGVVIGRMEEKIKRLSLSF